MDLDQNSIIQWLKILDIISIKSTDNVIFLQQQMVCSLEFQFRSCILGVYNLCSSLHPWKEVELKNDEQVQGIELEKVYVSEIPLKMTYENICNI